MLALIAGRGDLPREIIAHLGGDLIVCAMENAPPDDGINVDIFFRLERLGEFLAALRGRGVTDLCMAGGVQRPDLSLHRLGWRTIALLPTIRRAMHDGDDGALRAAVSVIEKSGIKVIGAHEVIPDLVMEAGVYSTAQPTTLAVKDASRGQAILDVMSVADIGQSCVISRGQSLAVEGIFGTDWMLQSLRNRPDSTGGGLLYKTPKPAQDRRVDLPTIGTGTVAGAVAAGLDGIVIEAGGVIVLNAPAVIADCDSAGLFFWVRERQG